MLWVVIISLLKNVHKSTRFYRDVDVVKAFFLTSTQHATRSFYNRMRKGVKVTADLANFLLWKWITYGLADYEKDGALVEHITSG